MQKVLTAKEMREVDRQTLERYGIPSILLMENAAHAAARVITEKLGGSVAGKSFLILCGIGNNGGDGASLARILWTQGADVYVYLFGKVEDTKGDARTNFESVKKIAATGKLFFEENILIDYWFHTEGFEIDKYDFLIDALFGTGLTRPLDLTYTNFGCLYSFYQDSNRPIFLSLDLPSGLNSNQASAIGINIQSDITVTFTAPKLANVFPPASNFNGELVVVNIGSPQELIDASPSQIFVSEKQDAVNWLDKTKVQTNSYKKTRGTALIIAGSENFSGAAVLAANACFSTGAGMISVAVPQSVKAIVASKVADEIIVKTLETTNVSDEKVEVVAIGCGLANDETTRKFIRTTIENRRTPMVLDAEALNALAPFDLQNSSELPLILTPHIGEFKRLLGSDAEIENRIEAAREFAGKHRVILILKGERSLIAAPDGRVVINSTGNAGISRAGSGDTLTGIVTAFLAQTYGSEKANFENTFEAVVAALYISGLAGDVAAEKFGQRLMSASDIRDCLGDAMKSITN